VRIDSHIRIHWPIAQINRPRDLQTFGGSCEQFIAATTPATAADPTLVAGSSQTMTAAGSSRERKGSCIPLHFDMTVNDRLQGRSGRAGILLRTSGYSHFRKLVMLVVRAAHRIG